MVITARHSIGEREELSITRGNFGRDFIFIFSGGWHILGRSGWGLTGVSVEMMLLHRFCRVLIFCVCAFFKGREREKVLRGERKEGRNVCVGFLFPRWVGNIGLS